jgi:hypothetical protein
MKKLFKNLPVYVLSAALLVSSVIYSNEASSAPQYVTLQKYNKDIRQIATEVVKLQYRVNELESCLSNTTRTLTQSGRVMQWCP